MWYVEVIRLLYYLPMERMDTLKLVYTQLEAFNLVEEYTEAYKNKIEELEEENKKLKDRIDVLYEFIERNDKLVDEVIDEEDLDKLNRYIYIDDDLVDRTLESED